LAKRKKTSSPEAVGDLQWQVWPARQRPQAAAGAIALILGVSWYGYIGFGHIIYSIIALVVLTGSLTSFLFPSTYTINDEGIRLRGVLLFKTKRWDELACYLRGDDFIAVSTTAEPSHRSISRGLILRLAHNGEEVAACLGRRIPEWKRPDENGAGSDAPPESPS